MKFSLHYLMNFLKVRKKSFKKLTPESLKLTPESLILTPESSKLTPESEFDSGVSYSWRPSCEPLGTSCPQSIRVYSKSVESTEPCIIHSCANLFGSRSPRPSGWTPWRLKVKTSVLILFERCCKLTSPWTYITIRWRENLPIWKTYGRIRFDMDFHTL
jgi:hypothetical protein